MNRIHHYVLLTRLLPILLGFAPTLAFGYYNPSTGRWLSRDPVEETGGQNVYALLSNAALASYDVLGLLHANEFLKMGNACTARVVYYSPLPFRAYGKRDEMTQVGAQLKIEINCSCEGCECYKWRQRYTVYEDDTPILVKVLDNKLHPDKEWYGKEGPVTSDCTYDFKDTPRRYPPEGMYGYRNARPIQRVVVVFWLELVKLKNCLATSGGETVGTIRWGYWFTRDANGLLNWD